MKKYLILSEPEEAYPEQLNSYILFIMEIIELSKRLGRTFVLPYVHTHMRDSAMCEAGETDHDKFVIGKRIDPMEKFFDTDKLRNYVDIISFDEFLEKEGNNISCLYQFDLDHGNKIKMYGHEFVVGSKEKLSKIYDVPNSDLPVIALTGCRRRQHTHPQSPNWHNDPKHDYWEIRKCLPYNQDIVNKAKAFISDKIKYEYLAIHWRRGDRMHPELGKEKESIIEDKELMKRCLDYYLISPAKRYMKRYGLKKVFLATNSGTPWHLEYLESHIPIIRYPSSGTLENSLEESIVEQIICTGSKYYFSSPYQYEKCSSFSRWIIDDKKMLGTATNVSYQEKMRPLSRTKYLYKVFFQEFSSILNYILERAYVLRSWRAIRNGFMHREHAKVSILPPETSMMRANLFGYSFLDIDRRSLQESGSWNSYLDNMAGTADSEIIQKTFHILSPIQNPVLIDIGANSGSFSLLPKFLPSLMVHSFEPNPSAFLLLKENIRINGLESKVKAVNFALSDKNGSAIIHVPANPRSTGLATLGKPLRFKRSKDIEVKLMTLDEYVSNEKIDKLDFVKIDTEGAELYVLRGGQKTLKRFHPTMIIECDGKNTAQFGYDAKEIEDLVRSWGYLISRADAGNIICKYADNK